MYKNKDDKRLYKQLGKRATRRGNYTCSGDDLFSEAIISACQRMLTVTVI